MLTHAQIWTALDALAKENDLSPSALARSSGLDPTSFNKSKRFTKDGRSRWPSTESLAKVLIATNTPIDNFINLIEQPSSKKKSRNVSYRNSSGKQVPLIGFAQAGVGGFFDDGGFPVGQGWESVDLPYGLSESAYALKVSGDSMLPLYRIGDVVIVDPLATVRKGDRVVVKTRESEVMAKILTRKNSRQVELQSLNPEHDCRTVKSTEIEWIARIVWASQ